MSVYGTVGSLSRVRFTALRGADLRSPDRLPGGTRKVSGRRHTNCVRPVASAASVSRLCGSNAVTGPCQLLVDGVLGLANKIMIPVGDATALGTFRTRLETRTKESNMCASHWELLSLKAQ